MKKLGRTKRPHEKSPERNIQIPFFQRRQPSQMKLLEMLQEVTQTPNYNEVELRSPQ